MDLQQIYEYFNENYSHVDIQNVNPKLIKTVMKKDYMKRYSIEKQMDLLLDYVMSQDLCDMQE